MSFRLSAAGGRHSELRDLQVGRVRLAADLAGDFDLAAAEQPFRLGGGARWVGVAGEEVAVGRVHRVEIVEVAQVYVDPDDEFGLEIEFFKDAPDGCEHRAGFGGDVAEYRQALGKIGSDQSGQESIMIIHDHLAEWRRRGRDSVRLDPDQRGAPVCLSQ